MRASVVVAHGLSCPAACGILVPPPGIKPTSPALEGFFTTGPLGQSLKFFLFFFIYLFLLFFFQAEDGIRDSGQ